MDKALTKRTLRLLKKTRDIISDPKRWTQGQMAVDKDGWPTTVVNKDAYAYCAVAALAKAEYVLKIRDEFKAYNLACDRLNAVARRFSAREDLRTSHGFVDYNDDHSHKEVMRLFDVTISELTAKEAK